MSGHTDAFPAEDYAYLAALIRENLNKPGFGAVLHNNFNVILGALDVAAAYEADQRIIAELRAALSELLNDKTIASATRAYIAAKAFAKTGGAS